MPAIALLLAAFIFAIDGMFMFGKLDPKLVGVANAVIGLIQGSIGVVIGFTAGGNPVLLVITGLIMAFSVFYLILAWGLLSGYKLNALGWHCLIGGLWCFGSSWFFFGLGDWRFGIFGIIWGVLFLSAWIALAFEKPLNKLIGSLLWFCCIVTLLIPAYMMTVGMW